MSSTWKRWLPCRGYGWLVPVLPVLISVPLFILAMLFGGSRGAGVIAVGSATLLSMIAIAALGAHLNSGPPRLTTDRATGRRRVEKPHHALLWIPMQWWGLLLPPAGICLAFIVGAC